jgi:AraC-like DNA-binding protein
MRPLLAERVGALLTLAAETGGAFETQARGGLVERILRRIERDFADPELGPQPVADTLGISKRYLQALLAARGTSFVQQLAQVRLERACNLLSESSLPIAEIGFRCGFLDPGYFGRQFRRRFGATPREWRARR